eukprot:jgi/Chlat1/6356/Chrsp44S05827
MFAALLREHAHRQLALKDNNDQARRVAGAMAGAFCESCVDAVNSGVANCFLLQRRLEAETRSLHGAANAFVKHTASGQTLLTSLDAALKDFGDFENWLKAIEKDSAKLARALDVVATEQQATGLKV